MQQYFCRVICLLVAVTLVHSQNVVSDTDDSCNLPMPRFSFFMPLIFNRIGQLLEPESVQNVEMHGGQRVILSCFPGFFKKMPKVQVINATCQRGEILLVDNAEKVWLNDLACEVRPIEEVKITSENCPTNTEAIAFGYTNPIEEESIVLGEACYFLDKGFTHSIRMKMDRKSTGLRVENKNYFKQMHPPSRYKIEFLMAAQMDELNVRLEQKLNRKDIPFLQQRHFIEPNFLMNKQYSSILKLGWNFFMANGMVNLPNWDLLLDDVFKAMDDGKSFVVQFGTRGILQLPNAENKMTEIYLDDAEKRFPVPQFLTLTVEENSTKNVFLVLNDPKENAINLEEYNDIRSKCNSCDHITWLTKLKANNVYKDVKKGKVFCCN